MDERETLLAVSDVLVLTACQRAYSRLGRRATYVAPARRHNAYERNPIPEDRIEAALSDAWVLAPMLAARWALDVDPEAWVAVLDGYTRALLLMGQPHLTARLRSVICPATAPTPEPAGVMMR